MNYEKSLSLNKVAALVLVSIFVLFAITAPYTVQTGDTGELVTNSYFLRVSHPPGYPLWTLLYHLPVKFFPSLSPFHSASLLTVVISFLWIGLLLFQKQSKENFLLLLVLATSLIHWRYSILPDVFALHLVFLVLVFLVFMKPELLNHWWMILLISLSVTNHHTIVFFFPLYLYALFQNFTWKKVGLSFLFGFLSASLYLSLLLFHPEENGSWEHLQTFTDVVHHFLRTTYGTFSLAPVKMGKASWGDLAPELIQNYWSLFLVMGYLLVKHWKEILNQKQRVCVLSLSLVAYLIVFFFFGSISLQGLGLTVIERFLLQPILLMFLLCLILVWKEEVRFPNWLLLLLMINAGLNVVQNYTANNYRENTTVEDFALNALQSLPQNAVYHAMGDSHNGAAYYLHEVLKVRTDIPLLITSSNFKWGYIKMIRKYPDVTSGKDPKIHRIINYSKYSYFTNALPSDLGEGYKAQFYGAIFRYYPESSVQEDFDCSITGKYTWRARPIISHLQKYDSAISFDLAYGQCDYGQALSHLNHNKQVEAIAYMEKAVSLSPLSILYRERLCNLYGTTDISKKQECDVQLEELVLNSDAQYYTFTM